MNRETQHRLRRVALATVAWACAILALLASASAFAADKREDFVARRNEAQAANGGNRAKLYVQLARDEMEAADRAYTAGDVDQGLKLAEECATDAQKGTDAATESKKRLKDTELDLAKLERRTKDIARSLNLDDRPPVEKIALRIDDMRAALLNRMFSDEKKKEKPKP